MPYPYVVCDGRPQSLGTGPCVSTDEHLPRVVCVSADRNVYVTPLIVIVSPSCGTPVSVPFTCA